MRYHILKPTAPIYTAYTTLLTLYPLQVIKKFRLQYALQKSNFEILHPCQKSQKSTKNWKKSNLKVDALPYSSTDSTHIYRFYPPTIPLSIAAIKNYFGWGCQKKLVWFKIFGPNFEKNSNLKVDALPHSSTDSTHIYRVYHLGIPLSIPGIKIISVERLKNNINFKNFRPKLGENWNTKTQKHPNRKYRKFKIFMQAHPPSPNCSSLKVWAF